MLITLPQPCAIRCGITALVARKAPLSITSMTKFQSSSLIFTRYLSRGEPALLTRMCTPPNVAAVSSTSRRTSASFVTSATTQCAARPSARNAAAVACASSAMHVGDDHLRALFRQASRGGRAESACGAGDDGHLVLQSQVHGISSRTAVCLGRGCRVGAVVHPRFDARTACTRALPLHARRRARCLIAGRSFRARPRFSTSCCPRAPAS